jgi:gliding motility-associated-like protein
MQPYSFTANGKYSVQVTDANSCTQTVSFQLNPTPKFTAQFTTKNPSCVNAHDGEISVTVSGGTEPISYYARNAKVQAEQKHLPAGVYEYTIIDAAQCLVQDQISLTQASGVSFSIAANNPACSDQFATIRSNLQTETQWASYTTTCERIPDGKITDNQHITESGWYRLTVNETTSSICAIDSVQIKIPPKLAVLATINAPTCSQKARPLFLLIDGATPPYNATLFDLTKQQFVAITDSLTGGLYRYTVSDAHQCTHSEEFQLPVPECGLKIEIPNIFSPNSDGQNDYFSLSYENILHFKMQIFSRWGELLFETDQIESAWNGKNNSQHDVPQGVYMYVLEAYGWNGQHLTRKGTLELIR